MERIKFDPKKRSNPWYIAGGPGRVKKPSSLEEIMEAVVEISGISRGDICSGSRKREKVQARHMFYYCVREIYGNKYSLKMLGKMVGGRDHSSVIHGIKAINDLLDTKDKSTIYLKGEILRSIKKE